MTKQEAIQRTDYTEAELLTLAVHIAIANCTNWRDAATDDDAAWTHYNDLLEAFRAIRDEREEAHK